MVSSRIARCWPPVSSGWTPPARPAWLRPPTATRDPGHHPCGVDGVHLARTGGGELACTRPGTKATNTRTATRPPDPATPPVAECPSEAPALHHDLGLQAPHTASGRHHRRVRSDSDR